MEAPGRRVGPGARHPRPAAVSHPRHDPLVPPDPLVRRVRPAELDVLYPACVAMFTEELGISPEAGGGAKLYRSRVAQLINKGLAFARIEDGEVDLQGRGGRGHAPCRPGPGGLGQPGLPWSGPQRAGTRGGRQRRTRRSSRRWSRLYVNEHNLAARRAYARVGFVERTRFATILF